MAEAGARRFHGATLAPRRHPARRTRLGGPVGRHASRLGIWFTAGPWAVLLATVTWLVLCARQLPCRQTDLDNLPNAFYRLCYSDIPVVYQSSGLADGGFAYGHGSGVGQPAGTGVVMWALSLLVPGGPEQGRTLAAAQVYFAAWAGLVTILLVLLVGLLVRIQPRTRRDAESVAGGTQVADVQFTRRRRRETAGWCGGRHRRRAYRDENGPSDQSVLRQGRVIVALATLDEGRWACGSSGHATDFADARQGGHRHTCLTRRRRPAVVIRAKVGWLPRVDLPRRR